MVHRLPGLSINSVSDRDEISYLTEVLDLFMDKEYADAELKKLSEKLTKPLVDTLLILQETTQLVGFRQKNTGAWCFLELGFEGETGKNGLRATADLIAPLTERFLFLAQAYSVSTNSKSEKAEFDKWQSQNPSASLGDYANSIEVVNVIYESQDRQLGFFAEIKRSRSKIDRLHGVHMSYNNMRGRFAGILYKGPIHELQGFDS